MSLPETDLELLTRTDHEEHHETLHTFANIAIEDAATGDAIAKVAPGATISTVNAAQPHFVYPEQVTEVTHSSAGDLVVACARTTRAVIASVSADVDNLDISGMNLLGTTFSSVWLLVLAQASVTVSLTPTDTDVTIFGDDSPGAMVGGDRHVVGVVRWAGP